MGLLHRLDLRLPPAPVPEVITVHDLPPLRFSDEGELPSWSVRSAHDARLIICPSEFAAREVRELLGVQRLAVVPNGVSPLFHTAQPLCTARLAAFKLSGPFVLHAGGATARKNLGGLARAWGRLAGELPAVSLALAGPADPRRDRAFAGLPRVLRLGYLTPEEMAPLMAAALAVVVPSLYEGFGLPALEAMAAGVPVVATTAGALPEVCGDAAVLVEPVPEAIARAVLALASDADQRRKLAAAGRARAAGFSWDRTAQGHLAAYRLAFSNVISGP
ncbi:MAG: glycosyltransferase family 1 protein [Solirubrobacteraceae bacterium]